MKLNGYGRKDTFRFKGELRVRNEMWRSRGRPSGDNPPRSDARTLEYLVKISQKSQIDSSEFFNAIIHAWETGEARCRELTIQARVKGKDRCIFLITRGHDVVAQFPMADKYLRDPRSLDRFDYIRKNANYVSERKSKRRPNTGVLHIKDLEVGMKKVSIKAQVTEISKPKLLLTRNYNYALIANATLSDKTGTIELPLWNNNIKAISVKDNVQVDNARVAMFRGRMQLRVAKNGTLKVLENS